jgi:hypothetical protein
VIPCRVSPLIKAYRVSQPCSSTIYSRTTVLLLFRPLTKVSVCSPTCYACPDLPDMPVHPSLLCLSFSSYYACPSLVLCLLFTPFSLPILPYYACVLLRVRMNCRTRRPIASRRGTW